MPNLGNRSGSGIHSHKYPNSHKEEQGAKKGVDTPDKLINREYSGKDVIGKNEVNPPEAGHGRDDLVKDVGRATDKHHANAYQKETGEKTYKVAHTIAQLLTDEFRAGGTVAAEGEHTGEIVVDSTAKNTAEDYPNEGGRAKHNTHNRPKDRAKARNVEELD